MRNYIEKYKKLYESTKDLPVRNLKVSESENRGDDLSTSIYPSFESTNINLFLLSQTIAPNGFVETYCLSESDVKKLSIIRDRIKEEPEWKEKIIDLLNNNLSMPYDRFKKMSLGLQINMVNSMRFDLGKEKREEFDKVFEIEKNKNVNVKKMIL